MKGGGWDVQLRGEKGCSHTGTGSAAPLCSLDLELSQLLQKSPQSMESCPFFLLGHVDDERHEQRGQGAPNPRQGGTDTAPEPGTHPSVGLKDSPLVTLLSPCCHPAVIPSTSPHPLDKRAQLPLTLPQALRSAGWVISQKFQAGSRVP